jgi:predicted acyl esterase
MNTSHAFLLLMGFVFLCPGVSAQQEGREWEGKGSENDIAPILASFPAGATHRFEMMPVRDGTRLATTIFLPPGEGPWPVVFSKGFYGRFTMKGYAKSAGKDGQVVFVMQDARGTGDSEGKGTFDSESFAIHQQDLNDSLKWISGQAWCNGRIGVRGGSGNGVAAYQAFLSGSPAMKVADGGNSSGFSTYWMEQNRVRRGLYDWMKNNGLDVLNDERPTPVKDMYPEVLKTLATRKPVPDATMLVGAAWHDIVSESALDLFAAQSDKANIYVTISPGWHGGQTQIKKKSWPNLWSRGISPPKFMDLLKAGEASEPSFIRYYLMGDPTDPDSLGNEWKITRKWPIPHTPTSIYLHGDGSLKSEPAKEERTLSYVYDPADPAPAFGGNGSYRIPMGPADQRPLSARKDVLRFVGEPLTEPLTLVGKFSADLYISTDVPDTMFVVKVIDIHPDGTETWIRESAAMGRYAEGLDGETPLTADRVYHLKLDLWSTAKVINRGHRLGVLITSSAVLEKESHRPQPVFEVHTNTWISSGKNPEMKPATQRIWLSPEHPSSITLPVVISEK